MAKGCNRVDAKARQWGAADLEGTMAALEPWTDPAAWFDKPARERLFDPATVFWLFLSQMFSADGSCREAVQTFLARLAFTTGKEASPNTAAYCKARARLPLASLERARDDVAQKIQQSPLAQYRWCGRHVNVVDGTGISMPDTPENQAKYPQSSKRAAGCGFPEMRIVALFSLATGVWLRSAQGSRHVAERTLFRFLWDHLERLDVLRCRTPERVEKELAMRIIAYNLIRATLLQAAHAAQRGLDRISFKGTCQALRQWESALNRASPQQREALYRALLSAIARAPLPYRPNRTEPRGKKAKTQKLPIPHPTKTHL